MKYDVIVCIEFTVNTQVGGIFSKSLDINAFCKIMPFYISYFINFLLPATVCNYFFILNISMIALNNYIYT